jgi:hypothetical protein
MHWSAVLFGKYKGKTFSQIIVRDPDWFFWVLPKLYGKLGEEAKELARRARVIKIPKRYGKRLEVEYRFGMEHRFCGSSSLTPTAVVPDGAPGCHALICGRPFAKSTTNRATGSGSTHLSLDGAMARRALMIRLNVRLAPKEPD